MEQSTIDNVVTNSKKYGDVLVINDGSTDNTEINAKKSGAIVISNENNIGYDLSLHKGIEYAIENKYIHVCTIDADNEFKNDNLSHLFAALESGIDLVVGTRPENKINRILEKKIISLCKRKYAIEDIFCGLKGYKVDKLKNINFKNSKKIDFIGTFFVLELLKINCSALNINVEMNDLRENSRFYDNFSANLRVFLLYLHILFN